MVEGIFYALKQVGPDWLMEQQMTSNQLSDVSAFIKSHTGTAVARCVVIMCSRKSTALVNVQWWNQTLQKEWDHAWWIKAIKLLRGNCEARKRFPGRRWIRTLNCRNDLASNGEVTRLYSEGALIWKTISLKDHWSEGPLVRRAIAPNYIVVSALLCATFQQSYTPGMGVHRMSSVVVCKVVNRQADCWKMFWKVSWHHIPRAFLLWNFI